MSINSSLKIKAILLAAGFGTRLRPLTLNTPKCLIKIGGIPILQHWLNHLEGMGVESAMINTHYLHEKVHNFITEQQNNMKINIFESYEKKILGTAGTLIKNKIFLKGSTGLLIHADNYTRANLYGLIEKHRNRPKNCLLTMLTFNTDTPHSCGIITTDKNGVVQGFHEKVSNPPGNKANGAVYVFDEDLIDWITKFSPEAEDFSTDILPRLIGRIATWDVESEYIDIGTYNSYKKAQNLSLKNN